MHRSSYERQSIMRNALVWYIRDMRVTPEQAALVSAVLAFANLRPLRSVAQVQKLFRAVPGATAVFQTIPAKDLPAFKQDQRDVRDWLAAIATREAERIRAVEHAVSQLFPKTVISVYSLERHTVHWVFPGVQACYVAGVALILTRPLALARRLGQCRAPLEGADGICGRFRLDLAGKPRRYCNDEHRRRFDAADAARRVRKMRGG